MNVADFDSWRERYDDMSYEEMAAFYDAVEADHPLQKAFNAEAFDKFFDHAFDFVARPLKVLEVGGWKGELAADIIMNGMPPITDWYNAEICQRAVDKSVITSMRYKPFVPGDFPWNVGLPRADVLIASHFIEHIKEWQLKDLLGDIAVLNTVCYIGIQAPIPESGENVDWTGYHGTHILEIGWEQVSTLLLWFGFAEIPSLRVGDFRAFYRDPAWPG